MVSSVHLRLLRLLGPRAGLLVWPLLCGLAISALLLAQALVTAQIFVILFAPATASGDGLGGWLGLLAVLLLIRPLAGIARELTAVRAMTAIKADLRERVLTRLAERGPIPLTRERSGTVQSMLVDGVENLDAYYSRYLPQVAIVVLNTVVVVGLLASLDLPVAFVVGATALLVPLLPRLWDRVLAERGSSHWDAYSGLHADFVDSLQAMTTLKALGAVRRRQLELEQASDRLLAATMTQLKVSLIESGISAFSLVLGPLVAILISLQRIGAGALPALAIFTVTLLTAEMFRPFRELSGHWHAGYLGVFAGQQLLDVLGEPVPPEPSGPALPLPAGTRAVDVELVDVRYRYPAASAPALDGVRLRVRAGERIGLVGPSGSGKSTVAALLARFALPDAGEARLGGVPTVALAAADCVDRVAVVPQTPVLFHGTLRENLLDADPDADEVALLDVIQLAGLEQLGPDGTAASALDRSVGERGALLSGGQRQRVAIARAVLRRTPVLVLDEATSALDPQAEAALLARLREFRPEQTLIVIAHRLAAVAELPRIVVLADGRVREQGSAGDLLAAGGLFAAMARQQGAEAEAVR
ncbi:MAG: ATP-binding cassette domain-containing protein [Micropruina sp.]|uniref:ABC transporter ATP-binding protein/permease n=1 Tax=Micropruina sp. TaxID=2737536 RepID=UPI0039E2974D